jgi:hypothetical protein
VVGISGGDTDADSALTFLVFCLVSLLPLGVVAVMSVRAMCWQRWLVEAGSVVSYRVGSSA